MSKKSIFNASLEESMNLVTDKYIQVAMEDINKKGYWRKIIGFFTVLFFMICMYLLGIYTDNHTEEPYFVKSATLMLIFLLIGISSTCYYLFETRKVKNNRILSYYYFNKSMFVVMGCFSVQAAILSIIGACIVLGNILGTVIYGLLFLFVGIERYQWFKQDTLKALYGQQTFNNPLAHFLDYFVIFSKKYGGLVVLLIFIIQFFLPKKSNIYHNDLFRILGLLAFPLVILLGFYFIIALGADNFQGYYLKKYMEDYRQLSTYSIEEWYGKKSKKYEESLKNK